MTTAAGIPAQPPLAWWQAGVGYQVYPRSFADDDGDGTGDLPGLLARLGHLVALGVDAVWISPVFPSPMADFGYDVADHCDIDPLFGTLAEAEAADVPGMPADVRFYADAPAFVFDRFRRDVAAQAQARASHQAAVFPERLQETREPARALMHERRHRVWRIRVRHGTRHDLHAVVAPHRAHPLMQSVDHLVVLHETAPTEAADLAQCPRAERPERPRHL